MDATGNEFRDNLSTVDAKGKRIWIYPKKPKGNFYNYRSLLSYLLLAVFFILPFLRIGGNPVLMINILERKFFILGTLYGTQDFYLFVIGMIILMIFIVLFTVIYGRLFCGWVCPQTIFMEMVFRKIEYWIDGDANAQKRLDKAKWDNSKIFKRVIKHIIFFGISFLISNMFLSYIIGSDQIIQIITEPISMHLQGFLSIMLFSFVFYIVFTRIREQVCTNICPYGRLQGVLLDDNSLTVMYDFVRGEPRGKLKKKKAVKPDTSGCANPCEGCRNGTKTCPSTALAAVQPASLEVPVLGDCIDCNLCVQVCPTGIDIRNGTQLECVNCTACMDACDEVMIKINKPTKLIRLDSHNGVVKGEGFLFNKRVIAYSILLVMMIGLESFLFATRSNIDALILRTPGMTYQTLDDGLLSNLYNYQLINKTTNEYPIEFRIDEKYKAQIEIIGENPVLGVNGKAEGALFIKILRDNLTGRKTNLIVDVYSNGELIEQVKTTFNGPIK